MASAGREAPEETDAGGGPPEPIEGKGKGKMTTYLLVSAKAPAA